MAGTISIIGFAGVSGWEGGPIHLSGAGVFITAYIVMQLLFDRIVDGVYQRNSLYEYGPPMAAMVSAGCFLLFLAISLSTTNTTARSISAIFEYIVFIFFVVMNIMGVYTMMNICRWYHQVNGVLVPRRQKQDDPKNELQVVVYHALPPVIPRGIPVHAPGERSTLVIPF